MSEPLYHPGQMLRNLHSWAAEHPPRPVIDVLFDSWGWTYWFPLSLIRIEEHMLQPTGDPDIAPEEWVRQYQTVNPPPHQRRKT